MTVEQWRVMLILVGSIVLSKIRGWRRGAQKVQ